MFNFRNMFKPESDVYRNLEFFKTGYGQNLLEASSEDIFIAEFKFENALNSPNSPVELVAAALALLRTDIDLVVVNDESSHFYFIQAVLVKNGIPFRIKNFDIVLEETDELDHMFFYEFGLDNIELYFAAKLAFALEVNVILPRAFIRIINRSYQKSCEAKCWPNYFVYVENERYHQFNQLCKKLNISVLWNLFRLTPDLYFSYFNLQLEAALNASEFHNNYLYEESLFKAHDRSGIRMEFNQSTIRSFKKNSEAFKTFQQASFPVNVFTKKYLNKDFKVNSFFEEIYI
jgi:hypothetical protein